MCSAPATRWMRATPPRGGRWPSSGICSARSACRPARTAAPPAPTRSPTCSSSAAAAAGTEPLSERWVNTQTVAVGEGEARINAHFIEHPRPNPRSSSQLAHGMYSAETLKVTGDVDAAAVARGDRRRSGAQIAADARPRRSRSTPPRPSTSDTSRRSRAPEGLWDGHLLTLRGRELRDGQGRSAGARQRPAQRRRGAAAAARSARQRAGAAHRRGRTRSRTRHRSSSSAHGCARPTAPTTRATAPINRFALQRTGRTDPETGEESDAPRIAPRAISALRRRPVRAAGDEPRGLRRRAPRPRRRRRCCPSG